MITNTSDVFGLGILNGSSTNGSAYAYVSEFVSSPSIEAGANFTICANGNVPLTGKVGGGNINGIWSTNGFGNFTAGFTALTNTYIPSQLDTTVKPVKLFLTSTGPCPSKKDTLLLNVKPSPIVNASVDQIVCGNNSNVILNGTVIGGATTGFWTSLGSGTFTPNNTILNATYTPSSSDKTAGSVKLFLTSSNNGTCFSEKDTMKISITSAPTADAGPISFSVCANNSSLTVNGIIGGITTTGKWTTNGSGSFNPSNIILSTGYLPSVADVAGGKITLFLSSTNNLTCNQAKDSLIIVFTNAPTVNAGVDIFSCKNKSSTTLAGIVTGPTTSGDWFGGLGTFNPNNSALNATYTPTPSEISAGFVNLTLVSNLNGNCNSNADDMTITFVSKPFANFNFSNVCLNNQTTFTDFSLPSVGTINQWNWSFGDLTTSNIQSPSHTYSLSGTYITQLVVRNTFGCYDTIKKTPTVYPPPNANFGINRICTGAFLNLIFSDSTTINSPETITQLLWDFGGTGNSNLPNPIQLFPGSGLYNISLIATSNHGCRDTIIKAITLNPRPIAGFAYNISPGINIGTTVNFIDTSKYSSNWSWSFGDASTNALTQNASNIYYANGVYIVSQIAYDSYGCSDTARAAIRINNVTNEISTLIPNAISPNGDGKNDIWKLDFLAILYPNTEIDIFNRWGESVFHSIGYSIPWDGTYKGQNLPVGTYYYVINLRDSNNSEPFKGGVLLIR